MVDDSEQEIRMGMPAKIMIRVRVATVTRMGEEDGGRSFVTYYDPRRQRPHHSEEPQINKTTDAWIQPLRPYYES
jgi:hypothetical protein